MTATKIDEMDDTLRGLEGTSGRIYFQILSSLLAERYQFDGRSFRPAKDPFNAFLNYAYGVLYSRVEKVLVIAGLDPYVGFMHRDDYNMKSMVFDFKEPYRTYADEVVFKLFSAKKVNDSHTDKITNGFSLNTEGKNLLMQSLMQFLEEDKIRYNGKNQNRTNAMQMDAHQFANQLISKQ
ncbi:MAG: CRISPR-associated endonuclease Cas1 [Mangrovibacterium sp.]